MQLLKADIMEDWLKRKSNYLSHDCIAEIQDIFAHTIIRELCSEIREKSGIFGIIVDGTQDINGTDQESFCIRHVDKSDLSVHEEFIGLYDQTVATGEAISKTIQDILLRLQFSLEDLRAQTNDGASNMDGCHNGCQALIKNLQPLTLSLCSTLPLSCSESRTCCRSYCERFCSYCWRIRQSFHKITEVQTIVS